MKHNKRRNVGLMYEFLVKRVSNAIVEGDTGSSSRVLKLLKRHFKQGTELQREFRLFKALENSYVSDRETAKKIVETARHASRSLDVEKLDREKSLLIRNVNHILNDKEFYGVRVENYRICAIIQSLLNEWRNDVPNDIVGIAMHEAELIEHLLSPKSKNVLDESYADADDFVVNLMIKKLNGKYNSMMCNEQTSVLNAYVNGIKTGNEDAVRSMISSIGEKAMKVFNMYQESKSSDDVISNRLKDIKTIIEGLKSGKIDDSSIAKVMRIIQLKNDLSSEVLAKNDS